jgi:hypothetical protein
VRIDTQMEAVARIPLGPLRREAIRVDFAAIGAWLMPAVLIVYLALSNGGYGTIERSEVGIAVWWIVVVGTAVGALPVAGGTRAGRLMLALLAAFAAWTALSLSWTESAERTSVELGRAATYLGVFALALAVQGQGRWRHVLHGAATGAVVIGGVAVLSRLEPTWFPDRVTGDYLQGIEIERLLAYPLNYSTGLATFAALGLPLLLGATSSARTVAGAALAAAGLPVLGLALWLTHSGLAVPLAAIGLGAFLLLAPDRLPKLASVLAAGAGAAILIASVGGRDALDRGLATTTAQREGDEMLAVVLVVCVGVALIQVGISRASRYGRRPAWMTVSPRHAVVALVAALVCAAIVAVAAGAPAELSDRWDSFTRETGTSNEGGDPFDPSSSRRYKFWEEAVDANASSTLTGIGPGTFEFWWAREKQSGGFVRDAHSTFLETLAELGIVGLVLIGGFSAAVLITGVVRSFHASPELRLGLAAATGGCAVFTGAAAGDWAWELGVLPVAYLVLAAVVVAGGPSEVQSDRRFHIRDRLSHLIGDRLSFLAGIGDRLSFLARPLSLGRRYGGRATMVGLGMIALVAIAIPLASTLALDRSRSDAGAGDLDAALEEAQTAARLQPYAATPRLQEALVYERMGDLDRAVLAAREATEKESTNWRPWLILSRLEAEAGDAGAALDAYREAQSLGPTEVGAP